MDIVDTEDWSGYDYTCISYTNTCQVAMLDELRKKRLPSENDFKAVSATFCCYDSGANVSEVFQKIVTDQKDYHECSSCVMDCWVANIYQWITVKKRRLLRHLRRSWKGFRSCTEKGAITSPWWVLSTMEVRLRTWMV